MTHSRLRLGIAMEAYDLTRDLVTGTIRPSGIDLIFSELAPEEIFYRFTKYREWDVSEMSFAKYAALIARGETWLTAIPVFPSRVFRHSSLYVRADSSLASLADLAGTRVGLPEWAQTASVYTRAILEDAGVDLTSIDWVQAGVNQPGRTDKVTLELPDGIRYGARPEATLDGMLRTGEIDAAMSARPPAGFLEDPAPLRRLLADSREQERAWYERTGIFPIMHVTALRRDTYDRAPWIAGNLLSAFNQARERSLERARDVTASHFPLPWVADLATTLLRWPGETWPYGVEANRVTLDAFLDATHRQGVTPRRLDVEELFVPSTLDSFRV